MSRDLPEAVQARAEEVLLSVLDDGNAQEAAFGAALEVAYDAGWRAGYKVGRSSREATGEH